MNKTAFLKNQKQKRNMSKTIKKLFIFIFIFSTLNLYATDYTSTGSGNWSNNSSWSPSGVPGAGDNVTVASGHTITIDQDISINNLTVNGTLVIGNDATVRNIIISGSAIVSASGTFSVGTFDITHVVTFQNTVTCDGIIDFYNTPSQVANVIFDASVNSFTVGGSNTPQFNNVTFSGGTVTAGVSFDINGAVIIEDAATFDDGNFTHTVAGNWTENGTAQRTGNGTIEMDASLIQSVTTTATFYNLTYNGGGTGIFADDVTVLNNFTVTGNTEVQSSANNTFQADFTVSDGSKYTAAAGRATFNSPGNQTITIGTTGGETNANFYQAYFQSGGTKTIDGDIVVNSTFRIDNGVTVDDNGDTHIQTLAGGGYFNGTCNFSGTILFKGGTYYDTDDDDYTLGTADILIKGYTYIGSGDIMRVNGNVTIDVNDDGNHTGLIINDNSQLVGTSANTLLIKNNTSLYIRGADNFPASFGNIIFEDGSYARYDADITDQTIYDNITYWHLYLNHGTSKTAAGNLDINGNLYIYNATELRLGNYDMTLAGNLANSDDSWGNGSLTAAGGTVTLDAPDANQYIYNAGSGTYTFYNLSITNTAPSAARTKYFRNDIIVNGDFSVTNSGGSSVNRLYVDFDDHVITGGNNFNLGENVWFLTSGANAFQNSVSSFSGTISLDLNSTVRFDETADGADQNIPGSITYGNIELYGNNRKIPQANLDINGNMSIAGYTPVLTDNSHQINVAGNWNMSLNTTDLTGNSYLVFDGTDQDISSSNFAYVYFSGSGIKTVSGDLDILKDLVIQTNVTVQTDRNINIEGNWTEQGTGKFLQTGGITTFDGLTANQTLTTNSDSYFYSFYIDKSGSDKLVTANSDVDINGTFNFVEDNAEFDLNGNNLYVARDFYFREGCIFTHNNGKVFFDGNDIAQLIRNYNSNIITFYDAEFSGNAVKRLYDNSFKFEGNVVINNSTLDGQYWDHYVEGNWVNNGIFRHSGTMHFNGAKNQTISQSSFHSVRFGGGNYTKTLDGDINLTGNLWIDDATLDVSANNCGITLDDYWHNDSTGSFIPHEGTVTLTGEYNRIFTGATNTLYGTSGQVVTQGGSKDFYNLVINASDDNYWMFIHGNLTVLNNFEIVKGRFYQSYDANTYGINDIKIGGNFINNGSIYSNNYGEKIILNPQTGDHVFDPGTSNTYGIIEFSGASGTSYTFLSNLNLYDNREITVNNGDLDLNSNKITTNNSGGNLTLNGGSLEVDSAAILSIGNGATLTNAGGELKLIGHPDNPASLIATSGNFNFVQTSGTISAQNYKIEKTSGNGIEIQGGTIDDINTFQNGSFSGGTGTAYITLSGIDLGADRTVDNVTFNSGPSYNVQRTSGNGALNFVNAVGSFAGEDFDNDNGDPGTLINWSYPGAVYWDGNSDGDGDNLHWNDPQNWASDVVPDINSQVILDHNAVSSAYTVEISNDNAFAGSILINSGANQIELRLNGKELTVAEDLTVGANSVLTQTNAADTLRVGGSWSNEGTFNEGNATVVFNPSSGSRTITSKGAGDAFFNIIINGNGGTNVISSELDINGNFMLLSGTLSAGNNTVTVAGDWTRIGSATFDVGTSTVIFDGADQTVNGGEFYNLITSNTGTKTITANIDVDNDLTIGSGTVLDGGENIIYVGDDWTNEVGNAGFVQSGAGTVIFDGTVSDQNIGTSSTLPTTFNNMTVSGTRTKYLRQNITINGNLVINAAALFITDGTYVDGAGSNNTLNMSNGRIYVNGADNFPQNFENLNLSGGTVDYYADIDQSVYPATYYNLMVRRRTSGFNTTKTLAGDIDVKGNLYIYDDETLFDVNNHTIKLVGNFDKRGSSIPVNWGADGTLIHYGEYWTVDADLEGFNNVIKKNRGYMRVIYHSIDITGNMSILEDAYLYQDTVNITCTTPGKTFTLAPAAYVDTRNPQTLGTSTGRKAFPTEFDTYNISKDSRVYLRGTVGDQTIYTVPVYGNLYINTNAEININLDGNLNVDGDFIMYSDVPVLADNGYDINIEGDIVDIRSYTPSSSSTITFDGADQSIYDRGYGATVFDMNNVVFAGSGQKTLAYGGDDWYNIKGNLTINNGVTVYVPRRLDFSGENWTNNGIFNHTAYIVNFNGNSDQNIDPGAENDFYAVDFNNTGGTVTFINNGIDVNNGTFTVESGTVVNMNALTHNIASERITNNGTWITDNANFIWDRNGTQYIPGITAQDFIFRRYDQWTRYRYLEGQISIDDLTIEEGTQLRCSENAETTTPAYNVIMSGNFINNGTLYAWGNTFYFESNNTDSKIIKQGQGFFDNVTFNDVIWGQNSRTYTLSEETRFYGNLTIGTGALLDLNGQILRLGNDDPNDPVEPQAESHIVQSGGTLEVDEGASLLFSCRDAGNPKLDVDGTLKITGTSGDNAVISSEDWYSDTHRIDININNGGEISAKYYLIKYLVDEGLYIDAGAIIDPANNLSYGTWSDMNTSSSITSYYLECNADVTGIGTIDNVTFNFGGTPSAGHHFNVKRAAGSSGVLTFGGTVSGLLAGSTYEADDIGENNTSSSLIEWPPVSEVYWVGTVSTDWFTADNWSPATVPANTINAIIPSRANNPVITGQNAVCKNLQITDGFLTMRAGYDLTVSGDLYLGTGNDVGILAVEDPACSIIVNGSWTKSQNAVFVHGDGNVIFNATGGTVSVDPKTSAFGNLTFNGGASFLLISENIFVDDNFTVTAGTCAPAVNDYELHVKGNFNNSGGIYDNTIHGTVFMDGNADQTITNGKFWNLTIDGSNTKTTVNNTVIDGDLLIKNAVLKGGETIDMNGNTEITSSGTFDDGGYTHTFAGYRWTGTGAYLGNGTVEFDRESSQYINGAKFNNLILKNRGAVILEDDIDMTGNLALIDPNMYLNVRTFLITNTSGTGTFSMADTRRIYVRGANNFPVGFSSYDLHENSYTVYDGTLTQTIAPIPVIYGRLYLDNGNKTAGGHLDINGILYFYDDALLDVTSNNYRINIEGDWYNTQGATFIPHEGEVIFDGNDENTYLRITDDSKNTNRFFKLTVNKGAGSLRSYWTDITVTDNLRVLNGLLYQNQTMYVGGDMSAVSGTFGTSGTYYLNKTSGNSNLQFNGSVLLNLTIDAGAVYFLRDDLQMDGQFNLISGTFEGNGKLVRMGNYGEVNEISGLYKTGAGGTLQLPNYGTLKVNSGGEIQIVGDYNNVATVTNYTGRYYFNVENGALIKARNYLFEYMSENGIYIKDGATIDENYNFSYGTFSNPATGGTCLRIENNQNFTDAEGNPITEVSFPQNPGNGTSNVMKNLSVAGQIDFKDYSGEFAGEDFDNDPNDLINWISPPCIMWTGNIDNDWYKIGNWQVSSGPDRIPLITDNVIITKRTNQPVVDTDGALAKTLDVRENAILTLNSSAAVDTTLKVAGDVFFEGTITMTSGNDTLCVAGNWINNGMFIAGNGTVIFDSETGIQSCDNLYDYFFNLHINSVSDVQLTRNTVVNGNLIIKNGNLDMSADNRTLTVKGNFYNYDNFISRRAKLILAGNSTSQIFNPGTSDFYNIDINADAATNVMLSGYPLNLMHNMNINSGIFNLNGGIFNFGDASGTDVLTVVGTLNVDGNAYLKPANTAAVEINNGGTVKLVGTDIDHPAYLQAQSGTFAFSVNSGAVIHAAYYNIQNTDADGIHLKTGAAIDASDNFSNGVWMNGTNPGQYIWLENDFSDFTANGVYFHNGASVNVKRLSGTGIITFEDALGLLAGADYEDDNPAHGEDTGLIRWTFTHDIYDWTGAVDNNWNVAGNWNTPAGNAVPDANAIARIPDVSLANGGSGNFPVLGYSGTADSDGSCYDLIIEDGASLTLINDKNLDVDNAVTVKTSGLFDITTGSASTINVGDAWSIAGTFNHGGNSTVIFDAPGGKLLAVAGNGSFFNLTVNSAGDAEYTTDGTLHIDGAFSVNSGIFTVTDPTDTLFVGGNFTVQNSGTFNHGNSLVYLSGDNQNISVNGTSSLYKLLCAGGQTKSLLSDIVIESDMEIKSGVSLNGGANTLDLKGDWINNGTFIPVSGTVAFTGNQTQLIENYNTETFYNLSVNNTASVFPQIILYGDVNISGNSWVMTDGVIETTDDEMLTVGENVILTGGDTSDSYVNGPVTKKGDANFVFPLGDGTKFARLGISGMTSSAELVARYFEAPYTDLSSIGAGIDHVSGYEHWTLERTSGTGEPVVTLYWEDGAESGIDNLSSLTVALYTGGIWEDQNNGGTAGSIAAGSVTSGSAFTNFGPVTFASVDENNPLHGYTRWTGNVSVVWNNPNNWTAGVPVATMDALIPEDPVNQPVIDIDAVTRNLTIDENAKLEVNPLKSLTTHGRFTINGTFRLNSDETGNACFINNDAVSYGSNSVVETELYIKGNQYHHVSSPTTATHTDRFKTDITYPYIDHNFYSYDETDTNADWTATAWHEFDGNMTVMDGYTYYLDRDATVLIKRSNSGDFNTGDKSKSLTYTGGSAAPVIHRGWNFVGNPYPANLDWDASGWTKTNIYNSLYFWNGTNYSYYVPSGDPDGAQDDGVGVNNGSNIIPPMQGYFVKVKEDAANPDDNQTGLLVTPQSARTVASHAYYKNARKSGDIIRITVSAEDKKDETVVRFLPLATSGFDADYDAFKLFPGDWYEMPQIYSVLKDNNLTASVNTLSGYYDKLIVPLGFRTAVDGNFTVEIPALDFDEDTEIYFEDMLQDNAIFEISGGLTYYFTSDQGVFDDRFRLLFSVSSSGIENDFDDSPDVDIYSFGTGIYLKSLTPDAITGDIQITDISGTVVYHAVNNKEAAARINFDKYASGLYIVKLRNKYGVFTGKVFTIK